MSSQTCALKFKADAVEWRYQVQPLDSKPSIICGQQALHRLRSRSLWPISFRPKLPGSKKCFFIWALGSRRRKSSTFAGTAMWSSVAVSDSTGAFISA